MRLVMTSLTATLLFTSAVLAQTALPLPPDRHEFDSAGVKIHYMDKGQGEAVILIHGFGANLDVNWGPVAQKLSSEYRVIALDNRGHGRSDKPHDQEKYGIEMVNDIVRLMDHLDIKRAHIVGYSMGALITGKFLVEHPDRVISAVIGGMGWLELDDHWMSFLNDVASSLEAGNGPVPLIKFLHEKLDPAELESRVRTLNTVLKLTNDQKALAACARKFPDFAMPKESLEKNEKPTLAIVGDLDPFMEYVDRMDGVMSHLEKVVITGGDHMTTIRSPEFLNHIKAFLDSHRESAPGKPIVKTAA